jgi:hypothetical protein
LESGILVYIPCHSDFEVALNQVEILRNDFNEYRKDSSRDYKNLRIIVSVNAFQPDDKNRQRASEICDEVIFYGDALLVDVNISQGFLLALQHNPEIFWLLSTNDCLLNDSLSRVLSEFETDKSLDLIVANSLLNSVSQITNNMQDINGVISGVIYRTAKIKKYFNVAPFFPWTGWSHLAVIQSAMNGNHGLNILPIPQDLLFTQTNRALNANGKIYAHSFTGDLIQKFLFGETISERKRSLRLFVRSNFYKAHLFSHRDSRKHAMNEMVNPKHYLSWNSLIAESLLKSSTPVTYFFYKVSKIIPFEKLQRFAFFRKIQKRL